MGADGDATGPGQPDPAFAAGPETPATAGAAVPGSPAVPSGPAPPMPATPDPSTPASSWPAGLIQRCPARRAHRARPAYLGRGPRARRCSR